jgi:hypothetical protein
MDLVMLVAIVCLIGFLVYVLTEHVPMPPGWKKAIQIGALVVLVLYLISRLIVIPNVLP